MPKVTFKEEDQDTLTDTNITENDDNANNSSMIFSEQTDADFGASQNGANTGGMNMETWFPIFSMRNIVSLVAYEVLVLLQLVCLFCNSFR